MGTAALILGLVSLVISIGGSAAGMGWIGSVCGILGIIFGALGMKDNSNKGQAKAGLILSIIALTWGVIATIVCVACIGAAGLSAAGLFSNLNY